MKILKFLNNFNPFKKKKEKEAFPHKFGLIRLTEQGKETNLDLDELKVIEIYKEGKLMGTPRPYTEELVKSLEEIEGIPILQEKFKDEDEFVFDEDVNFGSVEKIR